MTLSVKLKNSANVKTKRQPIRVSKYENILRSLAKLQPGKSMIVSPPKGSTARQLSQRLHAIINSRVIQGRLSLPAGYRVSQNPTEDGDLAISLVGE